MSSPEAPASEPILPPDEPDDETGHLHRQLIGYLGLALPVAIWVLAGCRPTPGLENWALLRSVSAYYYTGAIAVFTGILAALAVFFFTYKGYQQNRRGDRIAAWIAAIAALCVALFPTAAPAPGLALSWWVRATGIAHGIAASILFLDFAYFSLVLFTQGKTAWAGSPTEKKVRNGVYIVCGLAMVLCIVWAGYAQFISGDSIFWPEVLALEFFAISWLVKGRAMKTAANLARRTVHYALHPRQFVADVGRKLASDPAQAGTSGS